MYLGRLLNLCDLHDTELEYRVKKACAKFGMYKKELTDKAYYLFQRMRLFNSVVTPMVLYGAGSWAMTDAKETLRTTQRKMLRSIFGKGRKQLVKSGESESDNLFEDVMETEKKIESWSPGKL